MSTETIFLYAMGVFTLMAIGIILTMVEFNKLSDEPSQRKGSGAPEPSSRPSGKPEMRVISSSQDAA